MNTPIDPLAQENRPQINEQRRRLAKAGLSAPVVIGALLSRPVLADAPHHCTISGQLSGNTSTHDQSIKCNSLGTKKASDWVLLWRNWSGTNNDFYIINNIRKPYAYARDFGSSPNSLTQFEGAYRAIANNANVTTRAATVLEVLLGHVPTYDIVAGTFSLTEVDPNYTLTPRKPARASLLLGQEALVAYLNAIADAPNFPLDKGEVVTIFNSIYNTGSYAINSGTKTGIWYPADVLAYFQSLHSL